MVVSRILRHANVSTTATYYIKTAADDIRNAMNKLENSIPNPVPISVKNEEEKSLWDTVRTLKKGSDEDAVSVN